MEPLRETIGNMSLLPELGPGPYLPLWQQSPSVVSKMTNVNIYSHKHYHKSLKICIEKRKPVMIKSYDFWDPETRDSDPRRPLHQAYMDANEDFATIYTDDPIMPLFYPSKLYMY